MPRKASPKKNLRAKARTDDDGERLQKVLAAAGIGSRRDCEQLITEGRVEVDREIVSELGTRVNPDEQEVRVDGVPLRSPRKVCYALNKPVGVVCTNNDPSGRTRVVDLIQTHERLYTIGRLDRSSEGLILVTNDGDLANRLTHPRYGVEKRYRVRVAGHPTPELLRKLEAGVHLSDGFAQMGSARIKKRLRAATELEIVLNEGRNREIRRLLARFGHKVLQLKRIAIGFIRLGDIPSGAYRQLTAVEVKKLRSSAAKATGKAKSGGAVKAKTGGARPIKKSRSRPAADEGGKQVRKAKRKTPRKPAAGGTVLGYDEAPTKKRPAPKRGKRK